MENMPQLSWNSLTRFVRQHTHDVRNHLNGMDLEAALLAEIVTDAEGKDSVDRIRRQIRQLAQEMRALSGKFTEPSGMKTPVSARELFLIWQDQLTSFEEPPEVSWAESVGESQVNVDIEAVAKTFRELLQNATVFGSAGPLKATASNGNGRIAFALEEPKATEVDPAAWGKTPFSSSRRGGYGLGLWEADQSIAASGGTISREFDPGTKTLRTEIAFPVV